MHENEVRSNLGKGVVAMSSENSRLVAVGRIFGGIKSMIADPNMGGSAPREVVAGSRLVAAGHIFEGSKFMVADPVISGKGVMLHG
jgi:hypothetical protein